MYHLSVLSSFCVMIITATETAAHDWGRLADDRCIALVFPIAFKSCEVSYKLCVSAAQRSIGD